MKILYFTQANLGLRRGHVFNILNTSRVLGGVFGEDVIISAPTPSKEIVMEKGGFHLAERKNGPISGLKSIFKSKNNFDIFYYRYPGLFFYAVIAKYLLGKTVVVEVHGRGGNVWEKVLWRFNLYLADKIIFITGALADHFGKYSYKGRVVLCNSYDPKYFAGIEGRDRKELRGKLGLPKNKTMLVYAGNTITYDFKSILDAVSKINDITFVIVGVTQKAKLEALIEKYNTQDKVILIKRTNHNEVASYLYAGDILLVPFVGVGPGQFPIKIFEYFGAGRPIISFKNKCIEEVLHDGENSSVLDNTSAADWEEAIKHILEKPDYASKIAQSAKRESLNYTWEKRGKLIADFLREMNPIVHRPFGLFSSVRIILNDRVALTYLKSRMYSYIVALSHHKLDLPEGVRVKQKKTLNIYLDKPIDEILKNFNDTSRNEVRKTFKIEELEFKQGSEGFKEIYKMYKDFNKRKDLPVHGKYLLTPVLKFKAYKKGILISAITCYSSYPDLRIQHIFSCENKDDKELRRIVGYATRRLVYEICKYGCDNGYRLLDFASINISDSGKEGIVKFKSSFGGVVEDEYTYTYTSRLIRQLSILKKLLN